MNEEATAVTLLVTAISEKLNISYLFSSSWANTLHGVAQATLDSDLSELAP